MSTYVINHLRLPGGIPNEEDMGPEKFDDGSRVFASDTGWASAEVSDLGETRIAWFRRGGYSEARRQPAAQFWACIWSLQRSALVQSPKSRYPSGRPLMNHTTTARSERGPITA